jgi:Carboxypeptidase regulatory-like domain
VKKSLRRILPLASVIAIAIPLHAAITGAISGTVSDPRAAVMPGIVVTALNEQTGVVQSTTTDSKGFYSFPALDVGTYTIRTSASGFQSYEEKGIGIDANSSVRTDIVLRVGTVTQVEIITSNTLQVETQSSQVGEVLESDQMLAVPLNGRSFTDLLSLQPGVSPQSGIEASDTPTPSGGLNSGSVSVNGGRGASNGYMINGGNTNDGVENTAAIIPNLDSIQEFRIITSNFDAEYGNYSGGQVNVVTKNGTNTWHGSGFEFARNTKFNATGYSFVSPAPPQPKLDQSIYGGTIGGPIKRDKVFFFADFQGTYNNQAVSDQQVVPTAADETGNVSDWDNTFQINAGSSVNGAGWATVLGNRLGYPVEEGEPYVYSGATDSQGNLIPCTTNDPTSATGCVFPGEVIPKSAWDPVASHMFQYIINSGSNIGAVANCGFGNNINVCGNAPQYQNYKLFNTLRDYKESGRVDVNTRFGVLFGYYFVDNTTSVDPFSSSFAGGTSFPGWGTQTLQRAQESNVGLTTTFKNNSVNNFRFTYLRSAANSGIPTFSTTGPSLSSLGFVTPWGPTGGISNIYPGLISVPTMDIAEGGSFGSPGEVQNRYVNSFQWLDNWMKIVGTHTLQFGVDYSYKQIDARNRYDVNGYFEFDDANETGLGFADFLLGAEAGDFTQASPQILDSRANYISGYAEDSWRARTNLTLNYGIRYEVTSPWYDTQNKLETIVPGEQSAVFPGAPEDWVFPGDKGVPRTLGPIKYNKFAPRFGFAYTPADSNGFLGKLTGGPGEFSIRGGFGIFYTNFQDESGFEEIGDAPYGNYYQTSAQTMMATPYVNRATQGVFPQQFPFTFPPTNVSASHPDNSINWASYEPITSAFAVSPLNTVPYLEEYSLGVQRAFGKGTVLTVNYVGNEGRHLASEEQANPGSAALCLALSVKGSASNPTGYKPNTTACAPKNEGDVYFAYNGTEYLGTRILPSPAANYTGSVNDNPAFGQNPYFKTEATSNYNSLQANLKHQSKIWNLMLGYTFGRSFDNASSLNSAVNVYIPRYTYALSSFDVTQYLVGSYEVHLPFDTLTDNRVMKQVIGGWSVSGITRIQTGTPISMSDSDDYSMTGLGDHPYYNPSVGPLILNKNPRVRNPANPTQSAPYFNAADFTRETKECSPKTACYGLFGNSPLRFFHGPGEDHTDLALLRDFHIHGEHVVQLRLEAFDVFNHAWFSNPSGSVSSTSFGIVGGAAGSAERIMEGALKYHF